MNTVSDHQDNTFQLTGEKRFYMANGKLLDENDFPRANNVLHMTGEEQYIADVIGRIEELGADVLLTDTVILLVQAKDKLSQWVDKNHPHANNRKLEGTPINARPTEEMETIANKPPQEIDKGPTDDRTSTT